jgi:ribosomal protein S18 acetylase RimI-like enzyme
MEGRTTPALRLREFVERDEAEVTSWFTDAGELRFFAGRRLRWPLDPGQWRSIRSDPSVTAWTGVTGESEVPVAHGELVVESDSIVRLARLAVAPRERGQGIGRTLVVNLVEKGRAGGYGLVTLHVHQDNTTAIRGYKSIGFTPTNARLDHSNIQMELALDLAV